MSSYIYFQASAFRYHTNNRKKGLTKSSENVSLANGTELIRGNCNNHENVKFYQKDCVQCVHKVEKESKDDTGHHTTNKGTDYCQLLMAGSVITDNELLISVLGFGFKLCY